MCYHYTIGHYCGAGRIRTSEARRQLIYSQLHLTTLVQHHLGVRWESNPHILEPQSSALTIYATNTVGKEGIEPST